MPILSYSLTSQDFYVGEYVELRLPARAHFHAFAPEEEARAAVGRRSRRTMSLDGQWHFRLLDSPLRVTPDLVSTFQEGWDRVELPHLWQFDGYGRLQYTDEGYPFPVDPLGCRPRIQPESISAASTTGPRTPMTPRAPVERTRAPMSGCAPIACSSTWEGWRATWRYRSLKWLTLIPSC